MNESKYKFTFVSLALSAVAALLVAAAWSFGGYVFTELKDLVLPHTAVFTWKKVVILILISLIVGLWTEKSSTKKVLPSAAGYLALWFVASVFANRYWEISLMFIPIALSTALTIVCVHFKKLWLIDTELTEKLVYLASTGHLLEGKSAELRIESGLRLLKTILPVSEAIVFRREISGDLNPIGRSRSGDQNTSAVARQSTWRENVGLCEEALNERKTVVNTIDAEKKAARVALPLIYEGAVIGVLYLTVDHSFQQEDTLLLEAFCGQLAQNFQRKELRQKNLPHQNWWSSFSTHSAENRLDTISLIQGIIKEQSFSAIASSNLSEAHAVAYLDGTLAYFNRQMRNLAKIGTNEFSDFDLFTLLERFKTDVFNEPSIAIRRVLQTGDSFKGELFFEKANQTLKMEISLVKVPLADSESIHKTNVPMKPACFLITLRDISAVKENEKLRSDMASLMSHELRTPITSIQGFAEIMLADENITEESKEFLTIIANESQRLSKMLTTFLSVSNLEQSDKKEVSRSPVKLDNVVHDVVNEFQESAKRKRIRLVEQPNTHLPPIAADKGLISRAISSLIDNAIRYSPERTSVIISTILESDFLRVVVEDRGYGIHASEHEKIWEKFYRVARDGQDKEEESVGLGLSLVREIVEQHGGNVEVESEVGRGSKFSLMLPRL
jgi:nitrogen-specific signal transduction histidine kinase/GAF domain-containing protein